ncbi:MAG: PadR family transcriptional regulator [Chloroflexota bacterium]
MDIATAKRAATLTSAEFQILIALVDVERHGYGIMQEVGRATEDAVRLAPGTLYRSIKRLLSDGLIEESDDRPAPEDDDERRRYYRLTAHGRAVAEAEARRLQRLVRVAQQKHLLPAPAIVRREGS